jgi:hypothetical protein
MTNKHFRGMYVLQDCFVQKLVHFDVDILAALHANHGTLGFSFQEGQNTCSRGLYDFRTSFTNALSKGEW